MSDNLQVLTPKDVLECGGLCSSEQNSYGMSSSISSERPCSTNDWNVVFESFFISERLAAQSTWHISCCFKGQVE
jgi:hypothetical protein